MHISKYTLIIPLENKKNLVCNLLSKSIFILDEQIVDIILKKDISLSKLPPKFSSQIIDLKRLGILVDKGINELKTLFYQIHRRQFSTLSLKIGFITTNRCNLSCEYCFVKDTRHLGIMEKEVILKTIEWINKQVELIKPREIYATLSGGEPLLDLEPLLHLIRYLKHFTESKGIKWGFGLISNGTLLNEEVIKKLIDMGLKSLQITIDGPRHIHDRRRYFPNFHGSFDKTFEGLLIATKFLKKVHVRVNIDYQNYKSVPELLSIFNEHKLNKKIIIDFARVIETRKNNSFCHSQRNTQYGSEAIKWLIYCYKEVEKLGFVRSKDFDSVVRSIGPCSVIAENVFIIDTLGYIHKCTMLAGKRKFAIGHVGKRDLNPIWEKYISKTTTFDKECINCKYLPICLGGCCYSSYLDYNDPFTIKCEREFYEKAINELLKLAYGSINYGRL